MTVPMYSDELLTARLNDRIEAGVTVIKLNHVLTLNPGDSLLLDATNMDVRETVTVESVRGVYITLTLPTTKPHAAAVWILNSTYF